jgi:predicted ATP-dependent protease
LQEENLLKLVESKDILISVDGEAIGQINGLAVYDYGDYSFGKIGRITCTSSISDSGIINIERASHLSGKIHDKGVYILSGFLHSMLAKRRRLGLAASVCFEQSYGVIDGDSASAAELIAIISAMAEIPIYQNMAITGSVNQMGEIQSIGGVNEKVEGFYKVCDAIGKGKKYCVVIPHQNVSNLMLNTVARDAIKKGYLDIYPVSHIWEAFELLTGIPLGLKNVESKQGFLKNSALALIAAKLDKIHQDEIHSEHESEEKEKPVKGGKRKKAARSCRTR